MTEYKVITFQRIEPWTNKWRQEDIIEYFTDFLEAVEYCRSCEKKGKKAVLLRKYYIILKTTNGKEKLETWARDKEEAWCDAALLAREKENVIDRNIA